MHIFIGLDMSKDDFAVAIIAGPKETIAIRDEIANHSSGFDELIAWVQSHGVSPENTTICVENAGVYSEAICFHLHAKGFPVYLESAAKVKRAFTRKGHKTDPLDAEQIAVYACRFHDQLTPFVPKDVVIEQLNAHLIVREQLVKHRTALYSILHALQIKPSETPDATKRLQDLIEAATNQIDATERDMKDLIMQNQQTRQMAQILNSAPGVGPIVATNLLVLTNAFQGIDKYTTCAAYLGICPLKHESGSSIRKPAKSDQHGPARMRKLLHLAARSVVTHYPQFRAYYLRKQQAGKPKKLVLNNVANKLLRIYFAMIREQKMYDREYQSINPNLL